MSDCNRCLWATRNGSCASWDCRFIDQREAYEAYNREKADANKWISVSERSPKTEVLCCDKYGEMIIAYVYADNTSDTGFSAESETQCMYNCVAWQPLPEPYKEEEDGCVHQ